MAKIQISIPKWNIELSREISDKLAYKVFKMVIPAKKEAQNLKEDIPKTETKKEEIKTEV
jgi:hypothetical protein